MVLCRRTLRKRRKMLFPPFGRPYSIAERFAPSDLERSFGISCIARYLNKLRQGQPLRADEVYALVPFLLCNNGIVPDRNDAADGAHTLLEVQRTNFGTLPFALTFVIECRDVGHIC